MSHSLHYCNVVVKDIKFKTLVAYCAHNHKKRNYQDKCKKIVFQMLIMHKPLRVKKMRLISLESTRDFSQDKELHASFGEEMCKIWRVKNQVCACFDVQKLRTSG